jgi:hypothetical protein
LRLSAVDGIVRCRIGPTIGWINVKSRDLYQLLSTPGNGEALREAISSEMPAYRRGLAEREAAVPIAVECDGALLVIAAPHLIVLCEAYLADQLDEVELGYIATVLDETADFRFVSHEIAEFAYLLSTGAPSNVAVNAVLRLLREHAA